MNKSITLARLTLLLVVAIFLFISSCNLAQGQTPVDFTFNHLALSVKDVNVAAEFYKKVFQLPEITNRTANPGIRWISMNDGKELHLISNADRSKAPSYVCVIPSTSITKLNFLQ